MSNPIGSIIIQNCGAMISRQLTVIIEREPWVEGLGQDSTLTDRRKMGKYADWGGGTRIFLRGQHPMGAVALRVRRNGEARAAFSS
jgi:hypothetical protein